MSGAQIDAPERDSNRTSDQRHIVATPEADAPSEIFEVHLPGSQAGAKKEEGGALVRVARLFREGLRPSNLVSAYGKTPLVLLMVLGTVGIFGNAIGTVALPEIQKDLELNIRFLITLTTWVGLMATLLGIPFGFLGDRRKRVPLYAGGNLVAGVSEIIFGLSTGKGGLAASRIVGTLGGLGPDSVGYSLLADYVPPEYRGRSFAFRFTAYSFVGIVAPLAGGLIAREFGWRIPYIAFGIIAILLSLWFFRMPEPIRGYFERKAFGADEETARRQQEPPSFGEALRAAWGVRTLRRYAYALPFEDLAEAGFTIFFIFYLSVTQNIDVVGRGIIGSLAAAASLVGYVIGGPLIDKILGRNPGRVVMISGAAGIVSALGYVGLAFAPVNFWAVVVIVMPIRFVSAMIRPARYTVNSLVIPPRVRNLGLASLNLWTIPVFFAFPAVAGLGSSYGFRATLLVFVPFAIIGALIVITAGPYVEFDIRSAASAAMAAEDWRKSREEGRAKLLVMRDVDVHYDAVQVLFGVDLDVQEGEIVALLGTNGAGKSTLLRAISGTQQATGGAIVFDGRDITYVPPYEIASYGIAQTPGGRGIFPGLTVRENLQIAGWLYGQDPKHKEDVLQIFEFFPVLRERLDQQAGSLSGGEQQMLTLAQAFLARPKMLMIDELSLGLSPAVVEQLLGIVRAIHAGGTTIIIVEQSVNVALTLAQRAVFMEKGEVRFDGPTEELLGRPDIMRAVFLKGASALSIDIGSGAPSKLDATDRATALEIVDLTKSYGGVKAVDGVSFELRENEVLGLIGPNGAGKTTVLEMISGFNDPDSGQIIYGGRDITGLTPDQRAHLGLIRRFQDAKLFPGLTVSENIAIAFERQIEVRSMVAQGLGLPHARQSEQRIRRKVDTLIELLGLEAYEDKFISDVSTGTRRIVDIACVLASEPRVLLLDEPSSGLAQREAENLAPLLNQVRRDTGCSMIIIEHDMPLISAVSDQLLAMDLGKVVVRGTPDEVLNDERVVRSYLGTSEEVIQRSGQIRTK